MVWHKTELPIVITTACALLMLIEYFFNVPTVVATAATEIRNFSSIIAAFFLGLGAATLFKFNIKKIARRDTGWGYSAILLVTLTITALLGIVGTQTGTTFLWIYNNINVPTGAATFSLLAFFIASAAFRAFKARTKEVAVLLISAMIILFMNAPISSVIWPGIQDLGSWILNVPNAGGFRGMIIGVALGVIGIGIRILMGRERGYLGEKI